MEKYIAAAIAGFVACYYFLAGGSSLVREHDVLTHWPLVNGTLISREITATTATSRSRGGSTTVPINALQERFRVNYQGQIFDTVAIDDISYFSSSLKEDVMQRPHVAKIGEIAPIRLNPDEPTKATTLATFASFWTDSFRRNTIGFSISLTVLIALVALTF